MKRGRPTLAAQTKEEALHNLYTGNAPKRPRNAIEREVMRRSAGRKTHADSKTMAVAKAALWLMKNKNLNARQACKEALGKPDLNAGNAVDKIKLNEDNVRKYLRRLLQQPMVGINLKTTGMFAQLAPDQLVAVPLIVDLDEVNAAFEDAMVDNTPTN